MREKELRIALVCFGGISLAVYMHGVSKEILKLVRASSALHAGGDRSQRANARFVGRGAPDNPEYDTETVYFDLLREIGRSVDLRVVVDIIAGASAGGINGTLLARALAHDLPMGALRDLWLKEADVTALLAPEAKAKTWSKWFLLPFVWAAAVSPWLAETKISEVRQKLSLFVRSRWFKPPFSGRRMAQLMYDAVTSMGSPPSPEASLLPAGQQLDLFVSLTDHYGYQQVIEIHDPPLISEREHRHVLRFKYRRWPDGEVETDFALANAPGLAFAARATSSFPGAFPPAQIAEMDRLLATLGASWPDRATFIERNFDAHLRARLEPTTASFVDGAVLNNKPFREAIQAIRGRPAYRQVDRRLVYIDPDPRQGPVAPTGAVPGFFTTLKSALSDIPRNEPIADELSFVNGFNERVRRLKGIIEAARPHISQLVSEALAASSGEAGTAARIREWRERINFQVARDAGFAYEGYVRLKLAGVRGLLAQLIAGVLQVPARSPAARALAELIDAWAAHVGAVYDGTSLPPLEQGSHAYAALPRWVTFLLSFDMDFRKRRLYFLIQGQNRLYQILDQMPESSAFAAAVDRLKRDFYRCLDGLRHCERPEFFSEETRAMVRSLFADLLIPDEALTIKNEPQAFVAGHLQALDDVIERLANEIGLDATTHEIDALIGAMDPALWPSAVSREVLINYLGFPFWDVLTLSVTNWRDAGEFDEILVDRISPEDARTLNDQGPVLGLKGTGFAHFAAFFSRAYRENDYLLGRIHAVDRLIDIVCNSAGSDIAARCVDVPALKRRAFTIILDREASVLSHSAELVAELRRRISRINS